MNDLVMDVIVSRDEWRMGCSGSAENLPCKAV